MRGTALFWWSVVSLIHSGRIRGRGLHAHKGSGNTGVCASWEVSFQASNPPNPAPPLPTTPPTIAAPGNSVSTGGHPFLPSADAISGCGTCQWRRTRAWGPTSCRDSEGLGSGSRAWENRPSKLPGQFPPATGSRGLQGHSRALNIGTRRWKWFLPAAGRCPVPSSEGQG